MAISFLRPFLLSIILLSFSPDVIAQDFNKIDSLKQIAIGHDNVTRLEAKLNIAFQFLRFNLDSSDYYITEALGDKSTVEILPDTFFRHHILKAWYHQGSYNIDSSKYYYELALNKAKLKKERSGYIQLLLNYSSILVDSKDEKAFEYLSIVEEAIDTSQDLNHKIIWNLTYQLRSRAHANKEDYHDALTTLLSIMRAPFFDELASYRHGVFNSFSTYLEEIGDTHSSELYINKAISQPGLSHGETKMLLANLIELYIGDNRVDSAQTKIHLYNNLDSNTDAECQRINYLHAKLLFIKEDYSGGRVLLDKAIACDNNINDSERTIYVQLLNAQYAIVENNRASLRSSLQQIETLITDSPAHLNSEINSEFIELQLKNQLLALKPNLINDVDSLLVAQRLNFMSRSDRQLKELSAKYEHEKSEASIISLKKETDLLSSIAHNRGIAIIMASLLAIVAFILVFVLRKSNRIEKERNLLLENEKNKLVFRVDELLEYNANLILKQQELKSAVLQDYRKVPFKKKTDIILVDPLEINYILAYLEGVKVFFIDKAYYSAYSNKLKDTLAQLPENLFIQIKRDTLVNISRIKKINHNSVTLVDDTILDVGGTFKGNLQELKNTISST